MLSLVHLFVSVCSYEERMNELTVQLQEKAVGKMIIWIDELCMSAW